MKLSEKTTLTIALIMGIANLLTAISLIGVIISIGKILFSGFYDWQKELFVYSSLGTVIFFLISKIGKLIIRRSENQ